jgi:catechol 2,3-dioxygenase-like lactoylglutathione lyase family enzyme
MVASLGQYCLNVTDLEKSVAFYEALGLTCTSRTEIPQAFEAILEHGGYGSKMQLAKQREGEWSAGNAFWKLYINTQDCQAIYDKALAVGATAEMAPMKQDRWPVTIAFVRDPDGLLVEFVERDPWPAEAPSDAPWLGQYCLNVTDLDTSVKFWETLGLVCTSRTEIPNAFEAILEQPGSGSLLQLAQQKEEGWTIDMGLVWKLYLNTDDIHGVYKAALAAGYGSVMEPTRLDRWPVTVGFVTDPDGYEIELLQRDPA